LLNYDINVAPLVFDPMIASYLLNPGSRGHGLDNQAFAEFGYQKISFTQLTTLENKKKISIFRQVEKMQYG
jgi:DNA polymerase-1